MSKLEKILDSYEFKGELLNTQENTQGNINSTYVVRYNENGRERKYILQKINNTVFKEPYGVMQNIDLVTKHINRKLKNNNDTKHKTLDVVKTKDGSNMAIYINENGEKEYYRVYEYIYNCCGYDSVKDASDSEMLSYNAGKGFGNFHQLLDDFPSDRLYETIPNFHNTSNRFNMFLESIQNNVSGRACELSDEIVYLLTKSKECCLINEKLGREIPIRVTHNDTKINNILMDKNTRDAVAVIDLDTVMPGSILYDVGDGIRSTCASALEDETDLSKVYLDMNLTKAYLKGYLDEMGSKLTKEEIRYLASSPKVLTYELAIRFLTDYINGDTYFKIKYPAHNKDRFLNQFKLFLDTESKTDEIDEFIHDYLKESKVKELTLK